MRENDIEYQREQHEFWHKRASQLCEHNLILQKENVKLKKQNDNLKAAMKIVQAIKEIVSIP